MLLFVGQKSIPPSLWLLESKSPDEEVERDQAAEPGDYVEQAEQHGTCGRGPPVCIIARYSCPAGVFGGTRDGPREEQQQQQQQRARRHAETEAEEAGVSSGIAWPAVCSLWLLLQGSLLGPEVTATSHSPMVQVGSPSSCQTEVRDPGVPMVLQRPPASQPLCSHPRGAHVARPKVAKAQGISALLQPLGRARLCPAQQPHGLWAKTKDSSVGLKPVKQGTRTCPQRQAPGGSGRPREDWQEVPPV